MSGIKASSENVVIGIFKEKEASVAGNSPALAVLYTTGNIDNGLSMLMSHCDALQEGSRF